MSQGQRKLAAIMFTDIVGYTARTQENEVLSMEVLEKHNGILRPLFVKYRGKEIKTIGDSFLVEFESALEATLCAIEAQESLHEFNSSAEEGHKILVRIGIHLGDIIRKDGDVFGDAVNIASRIQPLAEPEGICISEQVFDQIHNKLNFPLEELEHPKLKNVEFATAVYRVVMPWQESEPPEGGLIQGEERAPTPNNLPRQLSLIGREGLIETVWPILLRKNVRILTLTGPGGIGKTSAGIEVARSLLGNFPDGVYFVPLAPISDSNLVLPTLAKAIGVKEQPNRQLFETLKDHLGQKEILLLLDNFEQIVSSSAHYVGELSDSCPGVKFIVTSRKPLRLAGEQEFPVPPLPTPPLKILPSLGELSENPSVALFLERTRAIKPDFEISNENSRDIAEICVKLDGLPLALELAAARVRILPVHMILARLSNKLGLLSGGPRDMPARQQALRNTIAWSYDLLDESEKKLFRRLAVFVGGFTLEAAERVCVSNDDLNVMDCISGLLDNSLLKRTDEQSQEGEAKEIGYRFNFLETIHEFASENFAKCAEKEAIEKTRSDYFIAVAEKMEPMLHGPESAESFAVLELEHDNMRASLRWCIERKEAERGLRLAGSLGTFWEHHSYPREGRSWLEASLKIEPLETSALAAKVLMLAGRLAVHLGDYTNAYELLHRSYLMSLETKDGKNAAQSVRGLAFAANRLSNFSKASILYEDSANLFRGLSDDLGLALSLNGLGFSLHNLGDTARSISSLKESIGILRNLGDSYSLASALVLLGQAGYKTEDYNVNRSLLSESLAIAEKVHDTRTIGMSLMILGELARLHGMDAESVSFYKQSVPILEQAGERSMLGWCYHNLGYSLTHEKLYPDAIRSFDKGISILRDIREESGIASCLAGLGGVALAQGSAERGARLFGAAEGILERNHVQLDPVDVTELERNVSAAKLKLGDAKFADERAVGRGWTIKQAVAYGLEQNL